MAKINPNTVLSFKIVARISEYRMAKIWKLFNSIVKFKGFQTMPFPSDKIRAEILTNKEYDRVKLCNKWILRLLNRKNTWKRSIEEYGRKTSISESQAYVMPLGNGFLIHIRQKENTDIDGIFYMNLDIFMND